MAQRLAHRRKLDELGWITTNAMIARPVKAAELRWNRDAQGRMQEEIDKLNMRDVWSFEGVRQWADVAKEAKAKGVKAHMGNAFGICVEKGSEMPQGHKDRKFKGRYVYQGNQVVDEYQEAALFNELGSSPATLEGAKAVDAFGCLAGHKIEQADASAAYAQALMGANTLGGTTAPGERQCLANYNLGAFTPEG